LQKLRAEVCPLQRKDFKMASAAVANMGGGPGSSLDDIDLANFEEIPIFSRNMLAGVGACSVWRM